TTAGPATEPGDRSEPPAEYEVDGYTAPFGAFARVRPGSEPYDEFATREEAVAACWAHRDAVRADLVAEVARLQEELAACERVTASSERPSWSTARGRRRGGTSAGAPGQRPG